jgi:hypothetical protein
MERMTDDQVTRLILTQRNKKLKAEVAELKAALNKVKCSDPMDCYYDTGLCFNCELVTKITGRNREHS